MVFILTFSLIILGASLLRFVPLTDAQAISSKRDEVILSQGQALRLEFQGKNIVPITDVSFKVKAIDTSDPFASYHVPLTVEVFEKNKLIGSESFTYDLGANFKKIQVDVNNDPKIKGNYKIVIRADTPEFNTDDNKVKVDLDTIKFNRGNVHMDLHGDIKILSANL